MDKAKEAKAKEAAAAAAEAEAKEAAAAAAEAEAKEAAAAAAEAKAKGKSMFLNLVARVNNQYFRTRTQQKHHFLVSELPSKLLEIFNIHIVAPHPQLDAFPNVNEAPEIYENLFLVSNKLKSGLNNEIRVAVNQAVGRFVPHPGFKLYTGTGGDGKLSLFPHTKKAEVGISSDQINVVDGKGGKRKRKRRKTKRKKRKRKTMKRKKRRKRRRTRRRRRRTRK